MGVDVALRIGLHDVLDGLLATAHSILLINARHLLIQKLVTYLSNVNSSQTQAVVLALPVLLLVLVSVPDSLLSVGI